MSREGKRRNKRDRCGGVLVGTQNPGDRIPKERIAKFDRVRAGTEFQFCHVAKPPIRGTGCGKSARPGLRGTRRVIDASTRLSAVFAHGVAFLLSITIIFGIKDSKSSRQTLSIYVGGINGLGLNWTSLPTSQLTP